MRGKHASAAARRREADTVLSEVEALRRKNVQLLAEVADLRSGLAAEKKSHQDDVRILRAQRDEGHAPLVVAAEKRYRDEIAAHQRTRAELKSLDDRRGREINRVIRHFVSEHGLTNTEALEAGLALFGDLPEGTTPLIADMGELHGSGRSHARQIQQARGIRRSK